jgi:transposase
MRPYSNDLREKIIQAYQNGEGSLRGIAKRFLVSLNFVWLLFLRFRETGSVDPKPHAGGHPPVMTQECLAILQELVERENDATLLELREQFRQKTGVRISRETIARALRKLRLTRKKKTFHATERENDPEIVAEREAFIQAIPEMDAQHLGVIDECGINLGMARAYGRAVQGCRAEAHRPADRGGNVTLIATLTSQGVIAPFMIPGSLNGEVFKIYVEQVLLPELALGDTVLLDNLSVHKVQGIADLLANRQAKMEFLPRYSPELSPIELVWSKIKADLCKAAVRTYDELVRAVKEALNKVSTTDAQACFRHCGYCIESG